MLVGASSTTIDTSIFVLAAKMIDYKFALALGCMVGVFFNFWLCDVFIFNRTGSFWKACARHYIACSFGLILNQLGMILLISILQWHKLIVARLVVATFTFMCNFFLIKSFAFASRS